MSQLTALQLGSPLSYFLAFAMPLLDAILPIVPSETAIIALGVATAGSADPRIALIVGLAALGAFLGDNLSYLLGKRFAPAVTRRFFSSPKGAYRRAWAEHALTGFGGRLILVCRFIPGGRTAVTLTCGIVSYRRRSFVTAVAIAALLWASYAFMVGRLGGKAFEQRPWIGFLLALGIALGISALVEVGRRGRQLFRSRHKPQAR